MLKYIQIDNDSFVIIFLNITAIFNQINTALSIRDKNI